MLPERIRTWLENRGISNESIEKYNLGWNGSAITIPVNGFNKYRKDPDNSSTDTPKYWYEKGHKASLYNSEILKTSTAIIICEGEFDCIVLNQNGFPAVTSTGGAGTFLPEWVELFAGKQVYICMDNDVAGQKAAVNLLFLFPGSRLITLPKGHKDVTDFWVAGEMDTFKFQMESATRWPELVLSESVEQLAHNMVQLRQKKDVSWSMLQWVTALALPILDQAKLTLSMQQNKRKRAGFSDNNGLIQWAKKIPLTELYIGKLTTIAGKQRGVCPFHNEKTGSFFIYQNNTWYCFGCSIGGDTIDFVMKRDGVDFNQALKNLKQ